MIGQGQFVIFTATKSQMRTYWLWHYFPKMMEESADKMAEFDDLVCDLKQAGFVDIKKVPFFVTNDLQDLFLQAGKYRPEIYLDPSVRKGISSFQLSIHEQELDNGLKKLTHDIKSGEINQIIQRYENDTGDYLFVVGAKR